MKKKLKKNLKNKILKLNIPQIIINFKIIQIEMINLNLKLLKKQKQKKLSNLILIYHKQLAHMIEEKKEKFMKKQIKKNLKILNILKKKVIMHLEIKNMIKLLIFIKK